jgi:cytoskeletal protein CcmA (bactofilin family)
MGKHPKDQPDSEHTTDNPGNAYNTQHSGYAPYQTAAETPQRPADNTVSRAITESESLARDIKEGVLSGFVGNGTTLTGEASFKGMLRVDGHLSGRVASDGGTLIVGNNGQVDANIEVAVAIIHGAVNGDVIATQKLELGRAAKVNGNIQTPSLVIEQGAVFEGSCKMVQLKTAQEKKKREDKPSHTETPLDATGLETIAETPAEPPVTPTEAPVSSVSDVAS